MDLSLVQRFAPGAPHAFVAVTPSGHRGIFARKIPSESRKGKPRGSPGLKIRQLMGPSLARAIVAARIFEAMQARAEAELAKHVTHELDFALRSRGGGDAR